MKQYQKISTTVHSTLAEMKERSVILTIFLNTRGRLLLKQYQKIQCDCAKLDLQPSMEES